MFPLFSSPNTKISTKHKTNKVSLIFLHHGTVFSNRQNTSAWVLDLYVVGGYN